MIADAPIDPVTIKHKKTGKIVELSRQTTDLIVNRLTAQSALDKYAADEIVAVMVKTDIENRKGVKIT